MQDAMPVPPDEPIGEYDSARAARKAQTRSDLRSAARQLFADQGFDAVTIADIAARASVSVQTVFNHFFCKEELFFDGRATWVEGPADAVRFRDAEVPVLTALRQYLVESVRERVRFEATPEGRRYTSAVESSASLSIREREMIHDAERRLGSALAEAWAEDASGPASSPSEDPSVAADFTAATWLATVRVLVTGKRHRGSSHEEGAAHVAALTDRFLRGLEGQVTSR